jgi:hypothetical protein
MTIVLKPDQEKAIQDAIDAGLIQSVDEFTEAAILVLKRQQREGRADSRSHEATSRGEAVRRMQEFGDQHRLTLGEPVTRKLLHEGHRL